MTWQSIDTAPKDGARVLIVEGGAIVIARWAADEGDDKAPPQWVVFDCEDNYYSQYADAPTHWMPLPPNPA